MLHCLLLAATYMRSFIWVLHALKSPLKKTFACYLFKFGTSFINDIGVTIQKCWLHHSELHLQLLYEPKKKQPQMENCHLVWNSFRTVDAQKALSVSLTFL